mmetsp:Transcript_12268/g.24960  ORF Transcript_12268/g.24960 Transcript_12268/m.24960 type:complete len:95 (-) Transcript_12268:200-484(-)
MSRVLLLIVASLCVASCLVVQTGAMRSAAMVKAPVRAAEPSMMLEESQAALSTVSSISETLAANAGDFGGMTAPIVGLGLLSAVIALLAGPIED